MTLRVQQTALKKKKAPNKIQILQKAISITDDSDR